jgi:hypothetical protein
MLGVKYKATHEECFWALFVLQILTSALLLDIRQTVLALPSLPNFAVANVKFGTVIVLDHSANRLARTSRERLDLVAHHIRRFLAVLNFLVEVKTVGTHVHPGTLVHAGVKLTAIVWTLVLVAVQLTDAVLRRTGEIINEIQAIAITHSVE